MPLNQYFQNTLKGGTGSNEFSLLEDLVIEAIKQSGISVKYMPRTLVKEDDLFSEDVLSTFDDAAEIEVYLKDVEGFGGEGTFLSRFGLEIRDQVTFTVARRRFNQIQDESMVTETGFSLLTEDGDEFLTEEGNGDNYTLGLTRPREGDLIFFPLNNKLFEIKFVEHEEPFYQLGKLYTYDLRCELFQYSSERLDTGNTFINDIETEYSTDALDNEFLLETGDKLITEDGSSLLLESYRLEDTDQQANNEVFHVETYRDDIINFDESNPFGGDNW